MKFLNARAIFFKELKGYFYSPSSYIFIIVFLTVLTWLFFQDFFVVGQASMRGFFIFIPWFLLFLIPALSMKIWSEEKRQGTIESLLVLPLIEWHTVVAKYLAGFIFIGISILFSIAIPISLSLYGDLDWGQVAGAYAGSWLLGGAFLALGQCLSAFTKNQIVSFLLTIVSSAILIFIGMSFVLSRTGMISYIFFTLSPLTHFENLSKGVIDLRDIFYFISFIGVFLYANVYILIQRHWK